MGGCFGGQNEVEGYIIVVRIKGVMPLDTEHMIQEILTKIRPYIQRDGGDVEYLGYEDGIVMIRLTGACVGCGLADSTIHDVIEQILVEEVPGVIAVEQVD